MAFQWPRMRVILAYGENERIAANFNGSRFFRLHGQAREITILTGSPVFVCCSRATASTVPVETSSQRDI